MINSSLRLTTITIFCCVLFTIACGSDNDKPSTTITKPQSQVTEEVIQVEIDFSAEEEKINQMLAAHTADSRCE